MYIKCINWAGQIKSLLDSIGMSYIWYNQNVNNINSFICEASCKIKDISKQNNTLLIERSTKCQFYKHITDTFCLQNYLTKSLTYKVKTAICKLRCSAHKLSIEQGRYMSVERNQRLCLMCNLSDIEDEFHFILKCPIYKDLRKKYIKPRCQSRPSVFELIQLFNTSSTTEIRKLRYFIINFNKLKDSLL